MLRLLDDTSFPLTEAQCSECQRGVAGILNHLQAIGSHLIACEGGRLGVRIPQGMTQLPSCLAQAMREHKAELLALLIPHCCYHDHRAFWQHAVGYWVCSQCQPAPTPEVETISLAPLVC